MRFLVDAQLPPALALLLAERGHLAEHVTDIGPGDAPSVVWIRVGNTRRASLVAWFEPLIEQIVAMVEAGERLIELR